MWTLLAAILVVLLLMLAFAGAWSMMIRIPGPRHRGPLPPLSDLQRDVANRLRGHVHALAGKIGERHIWQPDRLAAAADYIRSSLQRWSYSVAAQIYPVADKEVQNLEAQLTGLERPHEILVVGAHYDSVVGSPGADDNASGVAVLLVLAERFSGRALPRTVRFVAFVNEEMPFFQTELMGSLRYARECRRKQEKILGMISLETMGYFTDEPNSQTYPRPFHWFYPSTGDFIGFVSNVSSRCLLEKAIAAFRAKAKFPSEGGAVPAFIPGVGWSDHWSFWQVGYPAIMVTDTAFYRNPYYHTPHDTPDRLDYERLARVTEGLEEVLERLASDPDL
jgi:Zn-dependent M28 family amino/carboxypeptidase